ncbi:uncharacterized protein BDV17DRAFT_287653 [Aspergillus undulatus]|uniref:uncharacterized protein n=1 Tax=Aspergillus undulatus TaxID=1810928 RepID=UPI003CCE0FED
MSGNNKRNKNQNSTKPKRPPLTHFLCLPLINAASLPQLEASLASFKASIPPAFPINPEQGQGEQVEQQQQHQALIPSDAIRPMGTLHLTLGVMSLPTQERLEEALQFFRSLDLAALLHKAEDIAAQKRARSARGSEKQKAIAGDPSTSTEIPLEYVSTEEHPQDGPYPKPFTISLESMHVLPRARSATVLHAAPVDPTSRLYPFCEALRDKFLEAGFLQGEYKNGSRAQKGQAGKSQNEPQDPPAQEQPSSAIQPTDTSAREEPALLEEMSAEIAEEIAQQSRPQVVTTPSQQPTTKTEKSELKPRPLLLHATIVNTIYIKGRKRNTGGQGQGPGKWKNFRNERYTFDARDILSHYRNFYLDSERTIPRVSGGVVSHRDPKASAENSNEDAGIEADAGAREGTGYPFVWARDFPIDAVCICEMGAKKLDPRADESGMNARLGEKYTVVSERSLGFQDVEEQSGDKTSASA